MPDQLISRTELSRLPFRRSRRPEPGTTLVFQLASGQLVEPGHPYTSGETLWRGPKVVYVVDVTRHPARFECTLPSAAAALRYPATVSYQWSVRDAALVVRERIEDPAAECGAYLQRTLSTITDRFDPRRPDEAVWAIRTRFGAAPVDIERGIRIQDLDVQLAMDPSLEPVVRDAEIDPDLQDLALRRAEGDEQITTLRDDHARKRQQRWEEHYADAVSGGWDRLRAVVIARNPDRGEEILNTMIGLTERHEQRALEAIKALIDGGEVRPGDLDVPVQAAVQRLSALLGVAADQPGVALPAAPDAPPEEDS